MCACFTFEGWVAHSEGAVQHQGSSRGPHGLDGAGLDGGGGAAEELREAGRGLGPQGGHEAVAREPGGGGVVMGPSTGVNRRGRLSGCMKAGPFQGEERESETVKARESE